MRTSQPGLCSGESAEQNADALRHQQHDHPLQPPLLRVCLNRIALHCIGVEWIGMNWIGFDCIGMGWDGMDWN